MEASIFHAVVNFEIFLLSWLSRFTLFNVKNTPISFCMALFRLAPLGLSSSHTKFTLFLTHSSLKAAHYFIRAQFSKPLASKVHFGIKM